MQVLHISRRPLTHKASLSQVRPKKVTGSEVAETLISGVSLAGPAREGGQSICRSRKDL